MIYGPVVVSLILIVLLLLVDTLSYRTYSNKSSLNKVYYCCCYCCSWASHPYVGPGLGHLQLPVVLPAGEALEAEHLPGVVEARLVGRHRPRPRAQVLGPPVLLGQEQVAVGRAGVEGQGAAVWRRGGGGGGEGGVRQRYQHLDSFLSPGGNTVAVHIIIVISQFLT